MISVPLEQYSNKLLLTNNDLNMKILFELKIETCQNRIMIAWDGINLSHQMFLSGYLTNQGKKLIKRATSEVKVFNYGSRFESLSA
jgi:hypothetical protein